MTATYKYSIVDVDEDLINTLGAQGWRVIQVLPPVLTKGILEARLLLELEEPDDADSGQDSMMEGLSRMFGDMFPPSGGQVLGDWRRGIGEPREGPDY